VKPVVQRVFTTGCQRRSEGGAGVRAALGGTCYRAANGQKLFLKIHVKMQIVISYTVVLTPN